MMKLVSNTLKENLKKPTTQRKGRILVEDKYYDVYNVEYYQDVYSEGNVIGNAIASQLDFDLPYMSKFDTFKYFDGVWNGNEYEYVDMGTFHTFDEKDEDEFNKHITAFDNLIKFNATFVSDDNYPKTLYEELQSVCEQANVELATESIPNGDFEIENNQFVSEESLKTVLKNICGISGTYAVIKEDKLHLQLKVETSEIINKNEHTPVTWKRKTYGINQVILGMADVNGEYVLRQDDDDIAKNGVHKLVINDNFFAYTQNKREQLIDSLFNQVKGFGYVPFEMNNEWLSYLDVGDTINLDGIDTIVLRINGKSPNGIKSTMSAPSIIDAAVDYINNTNDIENRVKRTEIFVDKQNQTIEALAESFEEIKTDVVTSKTIEGNPIHITDAGAYDLEKLYLEGNSYQEGTPTPDTPQEIEVIEGSVDVEVTNGLDSTNSDYQEKIVTIDLQGNFLAKLGDVKDEIDVVTGKLTKRIGKVVLNSSNMSTRIVLGTGDIMYRTHNLNDIAYDKNFVVLCNRYKAILNATGRKDGNIYWNSTNRTLDIIDNNSNITTIEEYETWLSQNNVIVYYVLAEPYEVQLDNTAIRLNLGINNINVTTNIGASYISLIYLTDSVLNSQYATQTQLQLTKDSIQSVVKDTTTLNANLTDLQALVSVETTNLKNALGDLSNNLEEDYATNNSVLTIENSVSNIQTSLNQQIEITKDIQVNGVSKVKTTTGFTFDENGLTITKTNAETKTNIDEDGMVVYSTTGAENTEILVADAQGVKAENVEVRTYLVVGQNSRFQDYETGTGCFWVGK